jgi:RNA polymerase sigma factor (sigma-70 family)
MTDDLPEGSDWTRTGTRRGPGSSIDTFGTDPDDLLLLRSLQAGIQPEAAAAILFGRYSAEVRVVCRAQLRRDPAAVEEMVNETFARLFRHAASIRDVNGLLPWLRRTAKHACIDRRRRASARYEEPQTIGSDRISARDHAEGVCVADLVRRMMDALPGKQAGLLHMRYLDGMDAGEIAEATGSTAASIRTQLYEARRAARDALAKLRSVIPLPVLDWMARNPLAGSVAQHAALAALVPITAAVMLVPGLFPGAQASPRTPPDVRVVPQTVLQPPLAAGTGGDVAPAVDAPREIRDTPAASTAGLATAGPSAAPPAEDSVLQTVDVPVVGPVQRYETPEEDPERSVQLTPFGEEPVAEYETFTDDAPAKRELSGTVCDVEHLVDAVSCS